jgi:DNA-binding beta-propeller fold protein YncE
VTTLQSQVAQLNQQIKAGHPYIYIFSATGTAVVDPSNWQLVIVTGGVPGSFDNHYRDQLGRFWTNGNNPAAAYTIEPKTFKTLNTISLGNNILNNIGLTPDGKNAVVPVSTANQLAVYDTSSYQQVTTVNVGKWPCDMMVSPDGKVLGSPDRDSDFYSIVDPKTWQVLNRVQIGDGTAPYMDTISPDSKLASIQNVGYHGGLASSVAPPAQPTGKGFSNSYADLKAQTLIKTILLDFQAVFDEFTPDSKYDFIFGGGASKIVVVDVGKLEITTTIPLTAGPSYVTPDPNGKYLYASVKGTLVVIDTSSLQVVNTVQTGGISGTPLVLT